MDIKEKISLVLCIVGGICFFVYFIAFDQRLFKGQQIANNSKEGWVLFLVGILFLLVGFVGIIKNLNQSSDK